MKYIMLLFLLSMVNYLTAQELFKMPEGVESHVSSFENLNGVKGGGGKTNNSAKGNAFEPLKSGETKTLLDVSGAGIVQRMWITIDHRTLAMLRSLRLRMYWDGASKPAVDVPFGDFFCAGLGRPVAFQSALFSDPEGRSFNCYIPMPFKTAAKITITNETKMDLPLLFFDIDFVKLQTAPADMLYFHAYWSRQKNGTLGTDFELLPKVSGKGRFLGVNVGVNVDSSYGNSWWGEGEVKMYIDGDTQYPTINGTGTEDYIGTGWGQGAFTHQYQGCTVADRQARQYCFYRFHIPDQIFFYHDFKATIQQIGGADIKEVQQLQQSGAQLKPVSISADNAFTRMLEPGTAVQLENANVSKGWVNFYRIDDYSATAYFYLDKPENNLPELADVSIRRK